MKRKQFAATDEPALFDLTPYHCEPVRESIPDPSWDKVDSLTECEQLDDSLTPHDVAVSESMDEQEHPVSKSMDEQEHPVSESMDEQEHPVSESISGCLSTYSPGGTARSKSEYYRYSWRNGKSRLCHTHVPGGNTGNPAAQRRAQKIREAIARGEPIEQILKIVKA